MSSDKDTTTGAGLAAFAADLATPEPGKRYRGARDLNPDSDAAEAFDLVGAGAAGSVYLAEDAQLRRPVALKVLRRRLNDDRIAVARFLYEGMLTGLLQHPNIVDVYDLGVLPSNEVYYAMDLVNGKTLRELLDERAANRRAAPRERLLRIFGQVCEAVAYAHSCRVVHSDLKPENIMVGDFNRVYVMDWGVARTFPDSPFHEVLQAEIKVVGEDDRARGTPQYMSPEQVLGMARHIDCRSDVFSLGVILYEILTGRPPFAAPDVGDLRHAIAHEEPPPPRGFLMPRGFPSICERALRKLPDDRYADACDLAEDVNRALEGRPLFAQRRHLGYWLGSYVWRHKGGVLLAALAIGFALAFWYTRDHAASRQRDRLAAAERQLTDARVANRQLETLAVTGGNRRERAELTHRRDVASAAAQALLRDAVLHDDAPPWVAAELREVLMNSIQQNIAAGHPDAARVALAELDDLRKRGLVSLTQREEPILAQWREILH